MSDPILLTARGVLDVSGPDAAGFLQGLVTNDIGRAGPDRAVHAAVLTPQGKFLFELFALSPRDGHFLLETADAPALARKLSMHRLRAAVQIADVSAQWQVLCLPPGAAAPDGATAYDDPRLPALGRRALVPAGTAAAASPEQVLAHEAWRIGLNVPDLARDLVAEKDFALEGLLDELNGVDFHKGCYVGQEMTSRMKRRTTTRTKLCRIRFDGPPAAPGTPLLADGWEIGQVRSGVEGLALAMIRFDRLAKVADGAVRMDGRPVRADPPDWLVLPAAPEGPD